MLLEELKRAKKKYKMYADEVPVNLQHNVKAAIVTRCIMRSCYYWIDAIDSTFFPIHTLF